MTREQILSEIKRTAALNGGIPVGVRRFFAETGISQNVWSGKYWLRWSDALREAGFRRSNVRWAIATMNCWKHSF